MLALRKISGRVVDPGLAAALLWMLQRNGGYNAMREQVLRRVRGT